MSINGLEFGIKETQKKVTGNYFIKITKNDKTTEEFTMTMKNVKLSNIFDPAKYFRSNPSKKKFNNNSNIIRCTFHIYDEKDIVTLREIQDGVEHIPSLFPEYEQKWHGLKIKELISHYKDALMFRVPVFDPVVVNKLVKGDYYNAKIGINYVNRYRDTLIICARLIDVEKCN